MTKIAIVVEDCEITMKTTKFFLNKLGIKEVMTATNYEEFEKLLLLDLRPDLVVTDLNIDQRLSGQDVISKMSKYRVPMAVVSSEDSRRLDVEKCSWFRKPLDLYAFKTWFCSFTTP